MSTAICHFDIIYVALQSAEHCDTCEELERLGYAVCWSCGVRTSQGNMAAHLAGRKHQERMDLFHCDICNYDGIDAAAMIQHLRGRRHEVSQHAGRVASARTDVMLTV